MCTPVSVYETKAVISGALVRKASKAGPAGIRATPSKKSTSIPERERSLSETKATNAPSLSLSSKVLSTRPSRGKTSIPIACRYAKNLKNNFSGFKRSATVTRRIPFAQKYAPA